MASEGVSARTVIVEVAINGATPKRKNPNVPVTPEEIAIDVLACLEAGASIVHNHIDRFGGTGDETAARYLEGWRPVLAARPDALLYPTTNAGATVEASFCHLEPLVRECAMRVGLCDPGSVNFGALDTDGVPRGGFVYRNSHDDAYFQMELCRRLGLGPQLAIFEPGFLRAALAWWRAGRLAPGAMIKLYFGGANGYLGGGGRGVPFGLPPTLNSLAAYLDLLGDCDVPWSAAVIGGDLCGELDGDFVRAVLDAGGHLHVGLEDYHATRVPTNVSLLQEATAIVESSGRGVATPVETAALLKLPPR